MHMVNCHSLSTLNFCIFILRKVEFLTYFFILCIIKTLIDVIPDWNLCACVHERNVGGIMTLKSSSVR